MTMARLALQACYFADTSIRINDLLSTVQRRVQQDREL